MSTSDKDKKNASAHVVMGGKGVRCLNCGVEEDAHFPVRIDVLKAIGNAFGREHARCEPSESGARRFEFSTPDEWLASWDTGTSSMALWAYFTNHSSPSGVPHDPADFGRCHRLLKKFPAWRARLFEVGERFPEWSPFVLRWAELERLYEEEFPTGRAPKLYEAIQACEAVS